MSFHKSMDTTATLNYKLKSTITHSRFQCPPSITTTTRGPRFESLIQSSTKTFLGFRMNGSAEQKTNNSGF